MGWHTEFGHVKGYLYSKRRVLANKDTQFSLKEYTMCRVTSLQQFNHHTRPFLNQLPFLIATAWLHALPIPTAQFIRADAWRKPGGNVKSAFCRRMVAIASCTASYPKRKSTKSSVLAVITTNSQLLLLDRIWDRFGLQMPHIICILLADVSLTGYVLDGEELGRRIPHALRLVLARVGQYLNGAAAVPAQRLEELEAGDDFSGLRRAGHEDAQSHAVFDALGSALALV